MDIDRFRRIIQYSQKNYDDINSKVRRFYSYSGINLDSDVLNVLQIVRSSFQKKGYLIIELPFNDDEIGALYYKGDGLGYIILNTSLPQANVNFAIAHEIFHVFYQHNTVQSKIEFSEEWYYEDEREYAANLFAGILLMPEISFRYMFAKFRDESSQDEFLTIVRLMAYYKVPYMAVVIRCYELKLIENNTVLADLLKITKKQIAEAFSVLWLDDSLLRATKRDDFVPVRKLVERIGQEFLEKGLINARTLKKTLENMEKIYAEIKGD